MLSCSVLVSILLRNDSNCAVEIHFDLAASVSQEQIAASLEMQTLGKWRLEGLWDWVQAEVEDGDWTKKMATIQILMTSDIWPCGGC